MKVDESSLTGESLPVSKKHGSTLLAGAVVSEGEMDGVVSATGRQCFFGKTMALLDAPQEAGHLHQVTTPPPDLTLLFHRVLLYHVYCFFSDVVIYLPPAPFSSPGALLSQLVPGTQKGMTARGTAVSIPCSAQPIVSVKHN